MHSNQTSQFRHLKTKGLLLADSSAALLATSQVEPLELGAAGSIPARWERVPRQRGPRASTPASAISGTDRRETGWTSREGRGVSASVASLGPRGVAALGGALRRRRQPLQRLTNTY